MQRYFIDGKFPDNRKVTITGDDAKHIAKVMRQNTGDRLVIVIEETAYFGTVLSADFDVEVQVNEPLSTEVEMPKQITIACGLPKGDKLELITQKATELGVYSIIPFQADRSIVKWDVSKREKKNARLQKIAKEAAEQSHRTHIPVVHKILSFKELLKTSEAYDAVIVAYEDEARKSDGNRFAGILKKLYDKNSILLIFGPEGGISEEEVAGLEEAGALFTSLGPRILRTETAPLYALAAISYEFE